MCARIGRNLFQVFKTLNNNKLSYLQAQCAVKQVRIAQVKLFSSDQSEDVLKRGNESEAIAEDNLSIISSRFVVNLYVFLLIVYFHCLRKQIKKAI